MQHAALGEQKRCCTHCEQACGRHLSNSLQCCAVWCAATEIEASRTWVRPPAVEAQRKSQFLSKLMDRRRKCPLQRCEAALRAVSALVRSIHKYPVKECSLQLQRFLLALQNAAKARETALFPANYIATTSAPFYIMH